ncbi:uncharacterized protein K02A2.6-like [Drosophila rhopaloa]|uniref:RNA-directed DNA polymerase n=1 Tax=Drosophila rhopaloa TaxID=1041015 RepID=A0ABM5JF64_DRORH|nr:uncharacterized protein K02A2.6-like [Drosophila rhopaloa]
MGNADFLSRCPVEPPLAEKGPQDILMLEISAKSLVSAQQIASQTAKDNWVLRGWSGQQSDKEKQLHQFYIRRNELSAIRGVLVWGNRAVIPPKLRESILQALHAPHPGIVKMKLIARSYVWWPNMDDDIEVVVKKCGVCQQNRNEEPKTETHHWELARGPWSRLHIDHAGPFQGRTYFLVVDSFSKWLEVAVVPLTAAGPAVKFLRQLSATHGLPDEIVSDNGLLMNRHLKTYFDKLQPQEIRFDKDNSSTNSKHFIPGDSVWVRNYATGPKWITGEIGVRTGPISYTVRLEDNRVIRRHQDQLRSRLPQSNQSTEDEDTPSRPIQRSQL